MACFAVIVVYMDYDYPEGIECTFSASTKEECEAFVADMKKKVEDRWVKRRDYIAKYVNDIVIPEFVDHRKWMIYLSKYFGTNVSYIVPEIFKKELGVYLNSRYDPNVKKLPGLKDFDPPLGIWLPYLFVVEIT